MSGWWDGAYPHAAIKRFHTLSNPGSRLLLGPWNHGGDQEIDPHWPTRESAFDHASELLRFFDFHLKGVANGWDTEPPVHYFTTGEARWKSAPSWPPPSHATDFYLARERRAHARAARERRSGRRATRPTPRAAPAARAAGAGSRFRPGRRYGDRTVADRRNLVYESAPLEADLEVTGHPVLHLWLRADTADTAVFAYLEDVDPLGEVGYLTEGQLRARHRALRPAAEAPYATTVPYHSYLRADARPLVPGEPAELVFDLLPVSHLFLPGHRIRLAPGGRRPRPVRPDPGRGQPNGRWNAARARPRAWSCRSSPATEPVAQARAPALPRAGCRIRPAPPRRRTPAARAQRRARRLLSGLVRCGDLQSTAHSPAPRWPSCSARWAPAE